MLPWGPGGREGGVTGPCGRQLQPLRPINEGAAVPRPPQPLQLLSPLSLLNPLRPLSSSAPSDPSARLPRPSLGLAPALMLEKDSLSRARKTQH